MKYKRMAQFRYYGENNPYNFPENMMEIGYKNSTRTVICPSPTTLYKYNKPSESSITFLNLFTLPGTIVHVYINDMDFTDLKYVIGATGVLEFEELPFSIRGIGIDVEQAENLKSHSDGFFILTIMYEIELKEEEET